MSAYKQEVKKLASTIKQLAKSADGAYSDDVEKDLWLDAGVELGLITGYDAMKLNESTESLKSKILKEAVKPKGVSWITIDYKPVSDKKQVLDFFKDAIKKSGLKILKSTNNFADDISTDKGNIGYKVFESSIHLEVDDKIDFNKIKSNFEKSLKNLTSTLGSKNKFNSEDLLKKFNWSKFKVLVNDRMDDEEDVDAAEDLNDFVDAFFTNNTDKEDAGSQFSEEFYMQSYKEAENIIKKMIKETTE